jgi:imidazoleglycerol phosphate synthase glutamine amidotransferase subunit HisH
MGTESAKRNAIVVENKTNNSNESNVILPGVGKYRDYTSDTDAANGGVPLYGLYHNNGELRIRIN